MDFVNGLRRKLCKNGDSHVVSSSSAESVHLYTPQKQHSNLDQDFIFFHCSMTLHFSDQNNEHPFHQDYIFPSYLLHLP